MAAVFCMILGDARDLAVVTIFMAAIFWMTAYFWRMAVQRGSANDAVQAASDHEEEHHFYSRVDEVPTIFLSHSGKQKAFVENLYDALQRANHTAFFDKHTLPKGSPFPPHIIRAVDGCKLGVVVLSDDFLTSKWPMLELERLVLQKHEKGPKAIVLPLFYKLRPEDLKSHKNLSKWRRVWKEKAGQHADKWEQAVKSLHSFNGEVFGQGTSEAAYIKRVVRFICDLVPIPILYDLSHIQGHQRFAKEIASQFREQCDKVCMVGLYGVGGLGKTTMCKIMCNFYNSHLYPGKSYHIELPSDGDDNKIMQECMKALKKLANLSDEHLLKNADNFDQVVHLMRENLRRNEVFLAIDNVWESSLEAAKRILGVSFSHNSKILLTSRSEEVLKDLLRGHSNTIVGPLPSPDFHLGFQIFQDTFELGDLDCLVNRKLLDSVLKRCFFSGNYHALALKALGQYVKRACVLEGLDKIEDILRGVDHSTALQNVEDLIQINYSNLAEERKHMFLDIVVVVMAAPWSNNDKVTYEKAHQWLSFLYKKYSKSTIAKFIYDLALDGLIQLENIDDKRTVKMIRVHDLYSDLAQREAGRSARFFIDGSATSMEKIEWERLERVVILRECPGSQCFIEKLQQQECPKLQVLCATNIDFNRGILLDLMPSLCVLKLERGALTSIKDWSAATGLAIVYLSHLECAPALKPLPSLPFLEELIIRNVETVEGPPDLDGGQHHLKKLVLSEASVFKEGEESCKASYFNSLTNLESLKIRHFNRSIITRVLNLDALVNLKFLEIKICKSVKRIEGLDALKNLQRLNVQSCPYLSSLDGLSGLLQLASIHVGGCEALKRMPDLSGLTCLEILNLSDNKSMEEVVVSPALKYIEVVGCKALKRMPDLSGLACLETLLMWDNESMEEVGGENLSSTLVVLSIEHCKILRRFPSLNECIHLQRLSASAWFIDSCLENLHNHQRLHLIEGERTSNVEHLISGSFVENLQKLCLEGGKWTRRIECLISSLQELNIQRCESLVKLDVPSNLNRLIVDRCEALEEITGDLSALHLYLMYCPRLKKVGGLCIPHLQSLTLLDCESLEENSIPDVTLIPKVYIARCRNLNDLNISW